MKSEMTVPSMADLAKYIDAPKAPPPDPRSLGLPYVGFVWPLSEDFDAVKAANPGLNRNDPYLAAGGMFKVLKPLRFMAYDSARFWCLFDQKGQVVRGTYRTVDPNPGAAAFVNGKTEPFEKGKHSPQMKMANCLGLVGLVLQEDSITPATMRLKNANTRAGEKILRGAADASDAKKWLSMGAAHQASGQMPAPWMRYFTRISTFVKTAQFPGGYDYPYTEGDVIPISQEEGKRVLNFLGNKESAAQFDAVIQGFKARLTQMEALR